MSRIPLAGLSLAAALAAASGCGSAAAPSAPEGATARFDAGDTGNEKDAGERAHDAGSTTDAGASPAKYPALSPPVPQVLSLGGPVLASMKVVPVLFANDDVATAAAITDFVGRLGHTSYWTAATDEYGVGPMTAMPRALMSTADDPAGTLDDAAIQAWLAAKLEAGDPALPAPDGQTLYALFYPAGVTITQKGARSCADFSGYHQDLALDASHGSARVPYAVVPRCAAVDGENGLDAITAVTSHELVEGATDPLPLSEPAFLQVDDAHFYWTEVLGGSEVGDLCSRADGAIIALAGEPYVVQRTWSNRAAKAGHDPCVPAPAGKAYFNAAPALGVVGTVVDGQGIDVDGVQIPVGGSAKVALHLFSDAPTGGSFAVSARPAAGWVGDLSFAFDRTTGADGDVLTMTVQVLAAGRYSREPFVVTSTLGGMVHTWIGVVTN